MAEAFTAGVKLGGLTDDTDIRILLCYLIKSTAPVTREAMQGALLQEELVNYFEFADALQELQNQGLAELAADGYRITQKGAIVADTLSNDLPRSVRESAIRALIRIQSWVHKAAESHAVVEKEKDGYLVRCSIQEGDSELFALKLAMPDALTAEETKNRFIACGSELYATLLTALTQPLPEDAQPPEAVR